MRIFLTNDDGIEADGLKTLEKELVEAGHELWVVAPDKERSASSHSLTLRDPIRVSKKGKNRFAITGKPVDCVILGLEEIVGKNFDLVISGINRGQNMGEDIFYSGTVAAAMEAKVFGLPSIAVSLVSYDEPNFKTGATFIRKLLEKDVHDFIDPDEILNINVPNMNYEKISGIKTTKPGHRQYEDFITKQEDHLGKTIYWIGGKKAKWLINEDSDYKAIEQGYISITPIKYEFTNNNSLNRLGNWIRDSRIFV